MKEYIKNEKPTYWDIWKKQNKEWETEKRKSYQRELLWEEEKRRDERNVKEGK